MTGRDIPGELRRGYQSAESDSARLVYGALLLALGERLHSAEQLAAWLRSGTPAERALAQAEYPALLAAAAPADTVTRNALLDRMLRVMIDDDAAPWAWYDGSAARAPHQVREGPRPYFLLGDSLATATLEHVRGRLHLTRAEWQAHPEYQAAVVFEPGAVLRVGPFARVGVSWHASMERRPDQPYGGEAGGQQVDLMETPAGWVIIGFGEWIT
jgi:hypothetical protein